MQREAMKTREAELGGSGGATQIDSRGQKKSPQQQKKFAADTAKKTSQPKRVTNKAIARNEKIAPDVQKEIAGTDIEDSGVQLDALAKVPPDEQRKAVKAVNLGHAKDVRDVLPGAEEKDRERVYKNLCKWWCEADRETRDKFISNWIGGEAV